MQCQMSNAEYVNYLKGFAVQLENVAGVAIEAEK